MTYDDLITEARQWTPEQRAAQLKQLMTSPHFPALAHLLDYCERDFATSASSPKTSVSHGAMAHANGAKFGVETVQATLRGIFNRPVKTKAS